MRFTPFVAAILTITLTGSALAQEWIEFTSREDRFTGNFPSQPQVRQTTYPSQYGANLPARVYIAEQGRSRYSVTVADYSPMEKILTEKAQSCPIRDEGCYGGTGFSGVGHWRLDYQGALLYATWKFVERDAKVTQLTWNTTYGVGGHQIHLTNRDGSRTMAAIYMHESEAVHHRGDRARRLSGAGALPAIVRMARRERQGTAVPVAVPPRVPSAPARSAT